METAEINYAGELQTKAKHLKSGNEIVTDAPVDNNGKGSSFSPTDLLATSLVSCMMTIIGIEAEKNNIFLGKMNALMTKKMGISPRRVVEIEVKLTFEKGFTNEEKELLENAALNCPVAKSLHPEINQNIQFIYLVE